MKFLDWAVGACIPINLFLMGRNFTQEDWVWFGVNVLSLSLALYYFYLGRNSKYN